MDPPHLCKIINSSEFAMEIEEDIIWVVGVGGQHH
jgi:hypothetical protein